MKQNYEKPEVSVVLFENEDIVTTSGVTNLPVDGDNDAAWADYFK